MSKIDDNCGNCANVKRTWKMEYIGDIDLEVVCTVTGSYVLILNYRTYKFLQSYPNYLPFDILVDSRNGLCSAHLRKESNS